MTKLNRELSKGAASRLGGLLTENEAAKYLRVSVRTVQGWRCSGGGPPFVRLGRLVRYRDTALEAWLGMREVTSTSQLSGTSTGRQDRRPR